MSDNAQAGSQTGSGPTFRTLADSGNVQHPAAVLEYVITLSGGANVLQPVKIDTGLPVQPQTGAVFPISAAALPLPAFAATSSKQPAIGTAGTPSVDVISVQGVASGTAIPVSGSVAVTNLPGTQNVAVTASVLPSGASTAAKQPALGTAGSAAADVITVQGVAGMTPVQASLKPQTSGGLTPYKLITAGTTNATSVKGSAGQLYAYYISNVSASPRFVKFYDKASAPTVGTDTPVLVLMIPGNSSGAGANNAIPNGIAFASGIAFAVTGAAADNDATAITAADVIVNLMYA